MKIITVCGSMKFINEMMDIAEKLELEGNCLLMPLFNSNRPNKDSYTEEEGKILDQMHKERIKLADAIIVVNKDNYIGSSTSKEIEFVKSLNNPSAKEPSIFVHPSNILLIAVTFVKLWNNVLGTPPVKPVWPLKQYCVLIKLFFNGCNKLAGILPVNLHPLKK